MINYLHKIWIAIFLAYSSLALSSQPPILTAQPTTCIGSQFITPGNQYWKSVTLKLTNNCHTEVNFENTTVTFKSKSPINTSFWGSFSPLPYPDNTLRITSQPLADEMYLASLNMHFTAYPGSSTSLPQGKSIEIKYGTDIDSHVDNSVNVFVGDTPVETGSIQLKNASIKPAHISQSFALIHLTMNGQGVSNVQVPWNTTVTIPNLAPGTYNISPEAISVSQKIYQGKATPSTITLANNQQKTSTITYEEVEQNGKVIINTQLPNALSGYTIAPTIFLKDNQTGGSISKTVNWNTNTTLQQLNIDSVYSLSTPPIKYGNVQCTPTFNPNSLTVTTELKTVYLTYQCLPSAQANVNFYVTGAPTSLALLKVILTPNDNSPPIIMNIDLNQGRGNQAISLSDGLIYKVTVQDVKGYTIKITPQPLTAAPDAKVEITLTKQSGDTRVAMNGQLTVCGTKLCNKNGKPIQLKGVSSHGLQWFGKCMTPEALDTLAKKFKTSVIRLALYVQEGGYESNPVQFTQQVENLIEQITARGVYVIVDWHILNPGDPNYNLNRAKKFITDIATKYKNNNNILYEIANEPNGVSWSTIKNYANQIIPVIRAIDPNAPILVGTRGWSSLGLSEGAGYQEIVNDPVNFPNIMYTFHFYAASHKDNYLTALDKASNQLPIFVTEFGLQTYSGDGENDFAMSDKYMALMADKKISWANWNHSDDFRSGALWVPGTCAKNSWTNDRLKPSGIYIKNKILMP